MSLPPGTLRARDLIVMGLMALLLFTWVFPVTALAGLLSYKEIAKAWPKLGELIESNEKVREIVQNTLPSVALITLNACLPFLLEGLTYDYILFDSKFTGLQYSYDKLPGFPRSKLDRILVAQEVSPTTV